MGNYKGLKVSGAGTNLVPLSRKSVTKTITVVSGTVYTASARGKRGSFVMSGAATGTVADGSPVTFTASSNTLTLTVSGYLKHMQVEPGRFATQEIWTRNTSVARTVDNFAPIANLQSGAKLGTDQGAIIINFSRVISNTASSNVLDIIKSGSTASSNSIRIMAHTAGAGNLRMQIVNASAVTEIDPVSVNLVSGGKVGISWSATQLKIFVNGVLKNTVDQTIPVLLDSLVFMPNDVEAIYKGIYFFAVRPSDENMVIGTNY